MNKTSIFSALAFFTISLFSILILREYISDLLISNNVKSYGVHSFLGIMANVVLISISLFLIRKHELSQMIGLNQAGISQPKLLIFPLLYLPLINLLFMDDIQNENLFFNLLVLLVYCISIGFAEELSFRGFLQSFLIKYFGTTRQNKIFIIFISSIIFGILHFLKFDKGIYGELSQMLYATFIGISFGVLLLITKRIYPLVIIHMIIDFSAKMDSAGILISKKIIEETSLENALFTTAICLPFLIYALILIKKNKLFLSD